MSHFLDRLSFFNRVIDDFSDGYGIVTREDRRWEDGYRKRWQHDKIVRSTHGANCTGSCSWKIYVKGGIVTWETQQTDYPRTRPELPNHEPRGCSRGASYSWYLYSGNRVKYPLVRARLLKLWRGARGGPRAAGARYLSLLGGVCLSFYDWYCDLPPASPQTWGEQTDVPESADWYNSSFLMLWGSNVPVTRTPDAPFYTQVRYKGTKTVNISPDFNDAAKFADLWMKPRQGTDAALGMAMGHVIL